MGLLSDIRQNITNAVGSVTGLLSGENKGRKYPAAVFDVNDFSLTNKPDYDDGRWRGQGARYAFMVVTADKPATPANTTNSGVWQKFELQINPSEFQQDEVFAVEVTPTLRGVVVEHHGAILKDIVISGTTGISPNRKDGGSSRNTGRPFLQSGTSGYEEFNELRSYFRMYIEAKRLDTRKFDQLRMVFKNYKDQESIFVEPTKFTMKRSATRPLMYDYSISLKGVGVATFAKDIAEGIGPFLNAVDDVVDKVITGMDTANKVLNGSIGLINRTLRDFTSLVLTPSRIIKQAVLNFRGGLASTIGAANAAGSTIGIKKLFTPDFIENIRTGELEPAPSKPVITRTFFNGIIKNVQDAETSLSDAFGRDLTAYNAVVGRTPTIAAINRESTFAELQVLNALSQLKRSLLLMTAQQELFFEKNVFETNLEVFEFYGNKITLQTPNSVRVVKILGDDNIQTLAAREMGDVDKFREIVMLNNLKPPYIDPLGGPGVLTPGSNILIPQQQSVGDFAVKKNKGYEITKTMSESEKNMGVDLRINGDGDLAFTNSGDFDLLAGVENITQAIAVRLALERGGLKRHLRFGTGLQIGGKLRGNGLQDLREEILSSLGADPRIESIPFAELKREGNTVNINLILKLRQLEQPVPIPITLNI